MTTSRRPRTPLPTGFGAIWSTVAIDLVGFGMVLPILPLYAARFDASPAVIGLLVATFSLAQLVFAPLLGALSDRFGRKPVIIGSLVGTALGSLLTGLATNVPMLFAGRIVDGASGGSVSVAQAAVTDVAAPGQRARLLGLLSAAFGVGFVAGPALGSLAALRGPHMPFLLAAAISGTNALVAIRRLPETHRRASEQGVGERSVPSSAPAARRAALLVVAFLSLTAFSAFEATFALVGAERLGLGMGAAGAVFAGAGVIVALTSAGAIHPVTARLGETGALRLGLVLNVIGLAALAGAGTWLTLAPGLALVAAGQGLISPTLAALVARVAPPAGRGIALGAQQAAGGAARVVGPAVGGALFGSVGAGAPLAVGALLTLAALASLSDGRPSAGALDGACANGSLVSLQPAPTPRARVPLRSVPRG